MHKLQAGNKTGLTQRQLLPEVREGVFDSERLGRNKSSVAHGWLEARPCTLQYILRSSGRVSHVQPAQNEYSRSALEAEEARSPLTRSSLEAGVRVLKLA